MREAPISFSENMVVAVVGGTVAAVLGTILAAHIMGQADTSKEKPEQTAIHTSPPTAGAGQMDRPESGEEIPSKPQKNETSQADSEQAGMTDSVEEADEAPLRCEPRIVSIAGAEPANMRRFLNRYNTDCIGMKGPDPEGMPILIDLCNGEKVKGISLDIYGLFHDAYVSVSDTPDIPDTGYSLKGEDIGSRAIPTSGRYLNVVIRPKYIGESKFCSLEIEVNR